MKLVPSPATGIAVALVLLPWDVGVAHDLRLVPRAFTIEPGRSVPLELVVGDRLERELAVPFEPDAIASFRAVGRSGASDLKGALPPFDLPLFAWTGEAPGAWLLLLERSPRTVELAPARFAHYLQQEGLDDVRRERARRGETDRPGRERYVRCLKTIVRVGSSASGPVTEPQGQPLEIVPARDPTVLGVGAELTVRVRFLGAPLAGRQVQYLWRSASGVHAQTARTDDRGEATFRIAAAGEGLVRAVHMRRAAPGGTVEWESFWATLSFAGSE